MRTKISALTPFYPIPSPLPAEAASQGLLGVPTAGPHAEQGGHSSVPDARAPQHEPPALQLQGALGAWKIWVGVKRVFEESYRPP